MIRPLLLASIACLSITGFATAQTSVPNPLRPAPAERRAAEPTPAEAAKPAKPQRERSAKQRQNDDDMRACGATWRSEKATLAAKGVTWRSYLKDCRAAKKAMREKA